jgi:hypothetical protein
VRRLVQLVADYGPGDLAYAEAVQQLAAVLPQAELHVTLVAPGDTLAAGLCVAQLALGDGPPGRVVAHDVEGPARDRRMWIGRTPSGALVTGADRGWTWSFAAGELCELCALDVPADAELALAVRHATANHPHAVSAVIDRSCVSPPPDCAIVWVDRTGNVQTTLAEAPGEHVAVRIGDCRGDARVTGGGGAILDGELVLTPGARGLLRLVLGGGSAAERFGAPQAGAPVEVTPAAAPRRAPSGPQAASAAGPRSP